MIAISLIALEILLKVIIISAKSCKTFRDYSILPKFFAQRDCWYNPDVDLTAAQIIARMGYPSETHTLQTDDGYILTLNRIPSNKNGTAPKHGPVFLQHGLLGSSASFVITAEDSLAYILADLGYDVWLGNFRGNIYSRAHISKNPDSEDFWNFSWHEIGIYDTRAQLKYVASKTTHHHNRIIYIGHSMGTTVFYVYASLYPEEAESIVKLMVSFAPVAYMKQMKVHYKGLSYFSKIIKFFADMTKTHEILPNSDLMKSLKSYGCEKSMTQMKVCEFLQYVKFGFNSKQLRPELLPVIISHQPDGASLKTLEHFAQEIQNDGKFQHFDYGSSKENILYYGSVTPPEYNLSAIRVPIYLVYSKNDYLTSPESVHLLYNSLRPESQVGLYRVPDQNFNHIDFLWAKDVRKLLYDHIVDLLANWTTQP